MFTRSEWQDFSGNLSVIGVSYVFDSGSSVARRVFWAVLVVGATALAATQIYKTINTFADYPVSMNVKVVREPQIPFPTVTICKEQPSGRKFIEERGMNISAMVLASNIADCLENRDYEVNEEALQQCTAGIPTDVLDAPAYDRDEFYELLYHQYDTMIDHCTYLGVECGYRAVRVSFYETADFMGCARVQPPVNRSSVGAGHSQGLVLSMVHDTADQLPSRILNYGGGYQVNINDGNAILYMRDNLALKVGKGLDTQIVLQRADLQLLPKKTGCEEVNRTDDFMLSYMACYGDCVLEAVSEKCECDGEFCETVRSLACMYFTQPAMMRGIITSDCQSRCSMPCTQVTYQPTLTASQIDPARLADEDLGDLSENQSVTFLSIYFSTTVYNVVEQQEAASLWAVLSDIGGALSLLLGATIYSVVQIVDFLVVGAGRGREGEERRHVTQVAQQKQ